MSIKLIAVGMDGTFLSDQKIYNRERFITQYQQMKAQGIRFVVANENQYYQLISPFPEIANEIAFVAESGGWIVSEGKDVFNGELSRDAFTTVVEHLLTRPEVEIIACGRNSAYMFKKYDDVMKTVAEVYYHHLECVDNFDSLEGILLKSGPNLSDGLIPQVQEALHEVISDIMVPVHIGNGSIDLIIPGVHKASDLRQLQKLWGMDDSGVVVFGNGGNDIKMLCQTDFSFATENAGSAVVAAAKYQVGSNNREGVLDVIDKVLKHEALFDQQERRHVRQHNT